jgi:acetyl-CoA acetyltransferase
MPEVILVGGVRTALGRYGGVLSSVRPDDLAALVVREVLQRENVPDEAVDEVILGPAIQSGEDNRNVAGWLSCSPEFPSLFLGSL